MELSHAQLLGFRTKFQTQFNSAFELAESQIDKIALQVNSGRVELVNHRWMRGVDGMREFVGERIINNLSSDGLVVVNKLWESTLGIKRVDLERDQFGIYEPAIRRLGEKAKQHRDELGFGLLSDALTDTNIKAYDGVAFYGNHNANRTVAFNNKSTKKLNQIYLTQALTEIKKRKDSKGAPLAAASKRPLVIAGPAQEFTLAALANLSFIATTQPGTGASSATSQAASGENILKGTFDYIISPFIKTDGEWHVTLVDSLFKPIIWQLEQDIEFLGIDKFLAQWSMTDEMVNGVRALYNVAPGLPEMVYGSTGVDD